AIRSLPTYTAPYSSPRRMSGTHMTLESFRFTTLAEALNCASCSASLTITGSRVCRTRATIESESRSTARSEEHTSELQSRGHRPPSFPPRRSSDLRDPVVADVHRAVQLAAADERHAHDAGELQVHHAGRGVELRVVQRVADDHRLAGLQDARDDRVGEPLHR